MLEQVTARVLQRCRELGFALAGVCEARATEFGPQLIEWLERGRHGEMTYLQRNADVMMDVRRLVPGARSIICVADRYSGAGRNAGEFESNVNPHPGPLPRGEGGSVNPHPGPLPRGEGGRGRIAAYAMGDDYHDVMTKRLRVLADELTRQFPGEQFRVCVDAAPVMEREHAQRAGLGAIGKHTLLIEPGVGSYLLLGELVTTLALDPYKKKVSDTFSHGSPGKAGFSEDAKEKVSDTFFGAAPLKKGPDPFFDPCGSCTRCIDACPTGAIAPWSVDATKCISYLTIEHRSAIDRRYHEAMGDWVFGCDVCQEVCPHNQPTARTLAAPVNAAFAPRAGLEAGLDLLDVLGWTEADRREAFSKSAMKRAKLAMMKRNALIALGNQGTRDDAAGRARIETE